MTDPGSINRNIEHSVMYVLEYLALYVALTDIKVESRNFVITNFQVVDIVLQVDYYSARFLFKLKGYTNDCRQ